MSVSDQENDRGIRPYHKNTLYWQYKGEPVVLIGGSDTDNPFQWTGTKLTDHLDLLVSAGGNYIRNTMSPRNHALPYNDDGMAYPFKRLPDGKHDLDQWSDDYWDRLDTFLTETKKRGIIVQLEIWDAYTITGRDAWKKQPWDPDNNINYTYENTCLSRTGDRFYARHPFFPVTPSLSYDSILLSYQSRYIRKMLQICLKYDHVLYQIDNESSFPSEVSDYWANLIHKEARKKQVYVCDSRNLHSQAFQDFCDVSNPDHSYPLSHPELYNYSGISQNGGNKGQKHYGNLVWFRSQLLSNPRPINHTKIYQFNWPTGIVDFRERTAGSPEEGADNFWRNIFGGAASARHHHHVPVELRKNVKPLGSGLGLTPSGQTQLRSMRMLLDAMWIFTMIPRNDLLSSREENEAYVLVEPGCQYAVYFTGYGDGSVQLDLCDAPGTLVERWLDVASSSWNTEKTIGGGGKHVLSAPGSGQWAALLKRSNNR